MWTRRHFKLALIGALSLATPRARAEPSSTGATEIPDDPLAAYREQFKLGMDRYKAGALAEAIGYWEPIYRELGDHTGYRLAYDLGVAYQHLGDVAHAAERLQAFLAEVDGRHARGDDLPPIVEKEETDARSRVATLLATRGRIQVEAGSTPRSASVDASEPRLAGFVAWVTPGEHTVTFSAGTPEQEVKTIRVRAGEIVDVAPSLAPPSPSVPATTIAAPQERAPVMTQRGIQHPFPWPIVAVGGGLAIAATAVAVALESHAQDLFQRYRGEASIPQSDRDNFTNSRTWAYAAVGGAVVFAALTAGLAAWYFLGTSERYILVTPAIGPERGGASLGIKGQF